MSQAVQAGLMGGGAEGVRTGTERPSSGAQAGRTGAADRAGTADGAGVADGDAPVAWASRAQGCIMVLVLAFALYQGVAATLGAPARQRLSAAWDTASLMAGKTAAAVNYVLAHYLPADGALRAAGGVLRWGLFGSGGPQVWAGCDGWLYLSEELRPWPDAEANMRARGEALGHVAATLRERGIALVVAVVPDKARVERAHLCGAPRSAQAEARLGAASAMLAGLGVPAADLAAAFAARGAGGQAGTPAPPGPLYYRTDTHWNQDGAALAARAVAAAADRLAPQGLERTEAFRTTAEAQAAPFTGDLLRLMGLDKVPEGWMRPRSDRQAVERTEPAEAAQAAAAQEGGGGLLDDGPVAGVVLLGSSYSLNANFHGRLQEALRAQVGNFAQAGGGFAGAARTYLEGAAFRETPPKLVVWEVPERTLAMPLDAADRALLALR